ncbi:hypothetical protein KKD37_01475 [Patescibacteria group bacterium]|nr:hypothetical protein [Patescibacteria group bacterium]
MKINIDTAKIYSRLNPLLGYLQKQKENQKLIKMIELGSTFFLISFFTFFAIKPTFLTISTLLGDIKSKELLNTQLKKKINDVIAAQDLFSQVQERYYLVESSLPQNPRFYQATSQILATAQTHQIMVNKLDFFVQDNGNFSTNVSTSSSYLSAISFVSDILNNRRLIGLDSFTFSLGKSPQDQKVDVNIPLKVYYWPSDDKK